MADKINEQQVTELAQSILQQQYNKGLKAGLYIASSVVNEKLDNKSKSLAERVNDVKKYCRVAINQKEKFVKE